MAPVNVNGSDESQIFAISPEICEESHISVHKTLKQCMMNMDRNIKATKRSVLDQFDWAYSCERVEK